MAIQGAAERAIEELNEGLVNAQYLLHDLSLIKDEEQNLEHGQVSPSSCVHQEFGKRDGVSTLTVSLISLGLTVV